MDEKDNGSITSLSNHSLADDSGFFESGMDTSTSASSPASSIVSEGSQSDISDVQEVDKITAFVQLDNIGGQKTEKVEADMRSGHEDDSVRSSRVPVGFVNSYDGVNCGRVGNIAVSTYLEKEGGSIPRPDTPIQVFVKTLKGNTVTCHLTITSLVSDLATEAFRKSGVPAVQQRLVFEGKNLNCETKALVDYGVKNNSTVFMMGRLRGGDFGWYNLELPSGDGVYYNKIKYFFRLMLDIIL